MATKADNQEPNTETILYRTSSIEEPDKHRETVLKHYEAENVKDNIEGVNIDKLPSVGSASSEKLLSSSSELNTTVEICDKTEVSESLDGKETEDEVSKSLGVKDTEGQLSKSSDERKIEGHHVEKGELNSLQEIQLITKEAACEGCVEHNGGTTQEDEVYGSELTEENEVENLSKTSITLDGTEKITNSEPVTFEYHISQTSPEEDSCHTISSGTGEKELHMASASEDARSNLEETEQSGDMKEEITNNEKIDCDAPENVTLQSDYLSEPNKEEAERGEEMNACVGRAATPIEETCVTGLRSEEVESSSGIKEIASLDGQSEKVQKAKNIEINLPESPREARKDETIDASSTEKPPFDEKKVSAADLNEEDEMHRYDTAKGQQDDAPPLVHETEASEGTQLSVEEPKVMHDIDEADRKLDSSDLGLPLTPPCQIDAFNPETESNTDSKTELEITKTNTKDEEQNADSLVESLNLSNANDASSEATKEEIDFDSSSVALTEEKRDDLNVQQSEHSKAPQIEGKSETTGLWDGKESDMNDNINQNSKKEEHGETDTLDKEAEEIYSHITDKEQTTQSYQETLTTEESKVCQ